MKSGMGGEFITGHEIGSVGRVVQNDPAVALKAGTNPVSSMGYSDLNLFGPLRKHLAGK